MCEVRNVHNVESVNSQHCKKQALLAPATLYKHRLDLLPQPNPDRITWSKLRAEEKAVTLML